MDYPLTQRYCRNEKGVKVEVYERFQSNSESSNSLYQFLVTDGDGETEVQELGITTLNQAISYANELWRNFVQPTA